MKARRTLTGQEGFTLIEILAAAIILGIAVVGLTLLLSRGQAFIVAQGDTRIALYLTEQKIERKEPRGPLELISYTSIDLEPEPKLAEHLDIRKFLELLQRNVEHSADQNERILRPLPGQAKHQRQVEPIGDGPKISDDWMMHSLFWRRPRSSIRSGLLPWYGELISCC